MRNIHERRLLRDLLVIALSIFAAILFARSPLIETLFSVVGGHYLVAAFIAGIFFTSSFTTAPAIVVLARLCVSAAPLQIALVAAAGAVLGDLLLFSIIKGRIAEDFAFVLGKSRLHKAAHILRHHVVRWLMAVAGALIIASPLPDELGLALMGISKVPAWKLCALSYVFNFIGIIFIAYIVRAVV